MAERRINIILGAKDDASKIVTGVRGQFERFKRDAMAGFGLGAGLSVFSMASRAVGGLIDIMGEAQRAASDMRETQSKLDAVFVTSADDMRLWAEDAARSMGLSRQQALEAAGTFGNFTQALGLAETASAEMSRQMVQLAADLGSFNNADPSEVLLALRAGLSGETEPMRRFGVALSAAAVDAELMAEGVAKVGDAFTEADKIQARYRIIMRQTVKAQGDFNRTADGTANQQKTLNALVDDGRAKWGVYADAVANAAQGIAIDLLGAVDDLGRGLGDLQRLMAPHIAEVNDLDAALRALAGAQGVNADALIDFVEAQRQAREMADQAAAAERLLQYEVEQYRMSLFGAGMEQERIDQLTQEWEAHLRSLGITQSQAIEATGENARITALAAQAMAEFRAWAMANGVAIAALTPQVEAAGDATGDLADDADDARDALRKLAGDLDIAKGGFQDFWKSIREEQKRTRYLLRHPDLFRQEMTRIRQALEAAQSQRERILADGYQREDALALAAIDRRIAALKEQRHKFRALGVIYGDATEAGMEAAFGPRLSRPGLTPILAAPRAHGGPVPAFSTALVGERGPELLTMGPQPGFVTPLGAAGPIVINIDGQRLFTIMDRRMGDRWALTGAGDHYRSTPT